MPTRKSSPVRELFWNITCPVPRSRASMLATVGLVRVSLAQVSAARRGALAAAMTLPAPIDGPARAAEAEPSRARCRRLGCLALGWAPGAGESALRYARPAVGSRRYGGPSSVLPPWALGGGSNVEVEYGGGHVERAAGVGDVDDAADAPLDRGRAEQQVGLLTRVAELLQVLDGVQARPLVGQGGVHVVVGVGVVVDRDADERDELAVARLDPTRQEDRVGGDPVLLHAALDQVDAEVDEAAHLDGAAEGDLPVALAEVEVAAGQLGPGHVHREKHPRPAGPVLDVVVAAILPRRHRPGAFAGDLVELGARQRASKRALLQRGQGQGRDPVGVGGDQRPLPLVPPGQQLGRGGGAEQTGVGDAGVADAGQVPGGGVLPVEVPDRLDGVREVVGQEPPRVGPGKHTRVAPALARGRPLILGRLHRAELQDVDDQQVARLGALDLDWAAEHVGAGEVDVADVVGRVVVAELGVGPLPALDPELTDWLHEGGTRDVGMPAVVAGDGLVAHGLGLVDAEDHFWHEQHLPCWVRRGDALACLARSLSTSPRAAGSGHERQARARPYRRLARGWRAACSRKRSTYALDAPPIGPSE